MTVIVKIQDSTGVEIGSFEAEDQKSLGELAAMHGIEILQSCGTGFCGVCLCDVLEGGSAIELNKKGDHLFEIESDAEGNPKQVLTCVGGIKSEYFSDDKEHILVIKKNLLVAIIKFEKDFLLLLIQQDAGAFNTFYLQTVDIFYRYLKSNFFIAQEDAEDIIADFYVKFRRAVKKYDINQSFSAYVWVIFKNTMKDAFKKNKELPFSLLNGDDSEGQKFEDTLIGESEIKELLQQDFELEQIKKAMQDLDALSREIIFLKYIEYRSNTEISEQLLISEEVVRQRISRAFKKLRAILGSD